MKKILMLAALPLIILLIGSRCEASSINYLDAEAIYEERFSQDYGINETNFNNQVEYWSNNPTMKGVVYDYVLSGVHHLYINIGAGNYLNGSGRPYTNGAFREADLTGTYSTSNSGNYSIPANGDNFTFYNDFSAFSEDMNTIDWETIYYNPQIPVPKLNIWYLYQVESYREDGVANFTANIDVPDSTEFYVELAWKYSYPQQIRCYTSDMKGTPAYDYEFYKSSDLISIYSLQDMQQAINIHVAGSDLNTAWQAAYDEFIESTTFYTNQNNVPFDWLANARLKYVNKMGTQIPLYGNRLEVFARYWTLTEDDQVVVGKWYHWQSAKGSATEDVPETYVNYQELPGYAGTVENVPTGDQSTYTGTGETTGEQATTVINYAPNYPDYPTAVSYNHDNILLQMIQTSKQLPQFFGQFTNFLAITLAFIDPGVWAIIGFGFTCCIVIMIIKVL